MKNCGPFGPQGTTRGRRQQVERWFGLLTDKMIRRGTFHSVGELERAIYAWLANWNEKPKEAFAWKATADVILDKVRRCKELSGTAH